VLRPLLRVEGGILRPRVEKLMIGGRDKTKLVEQVQWQVGHVREAVGDIPVIGALASSIRTGRFVRCDPQRRICATDLCTIFGANARARSLVVIGSISGDSYV
jgi:hypothetical protein